MMTESKNQQRGCELDPAAPSTLVRSRPAQRSPQEERRQHFTSFDLDVEETTDLVRRCGVFRRSSFQLYGAAFLEPYPPTLTSHLQELLAKFHRCNSDPLFLRFHDAIQRFIEQLSQIDEIRCPADVEVVTAEIEREASQLQQIAREYLDQQSRRVPKAGTLSGPVTAAADTATTAIAANLMLFNRESLA